MARYYHRPRSDGRSERVTNGVTGNLRTPKPRSSSMSVTVRVPTTLRTLTGGASEVELAGSTVGEVLDQLESAHPGFKDRLLDTDGGLRRFVNLYVADDDVRFRDGLATPVADGDTVSIIPAVAGGA
jgi:MoaD family protein